MLCFRGAEPNETESFNKPVTAIFRDTMDLARGIEFLVMFLFRLAERGLSRKNLKVNLR